MLLFLPTQSPILPPHCDCLQVESLCFAAKKMTKELEGAIGFLRLTKGQNLLPLSLALNCEVNYGNLQYTVEPLTTISMSQRDYLRCYADT